MHLNEAPAPAAFCTVAENRFPLSLPAGEWSGSGTAGEDSAAQSQPSSGLHPSFSTILVGSLIMTSHCLMATLTIKQQLESKRLYLFVRNSSVEITLTTSSIIVKMGDTQSKSADKNEGE